MDDGWPVVRRNIIHARSVWGILGKLLRWEGIEQKVSAISYRAVEQAVLLFEYETWVLLVGMKRKV